MEMLRSLRGDKHKWLKKTSLTKLEAEAYNILNLGLRMINVKDNYRKSY